MRGNGITGHYSGPPRSGMVRFLTIFNLLAGAASIAGLSLALRMEDTSAIMVVTFTIALLLSVYVLLVPGNPLERNVNAKFELFRDGQTGDEVMVQRGTFEIRGTGPATVQYYQPFAEPPKVEVLHVDRSSGKRPSVSEVTSVHVEFSRMVYGSDTPNRFVWIARGKPLHLVQRT